VYKTSKRSLKDQHRVSFDVSPSQMPRIFFLHVTRVTKYHTNLLLTEREGRIGEYWPEVRTKTTKGQYFPLLYGRVSKGLETAKFKNLIG